MDPRSVKVLIAIQARSGSKRLPGKSLELIDDLTMTQHVINACKEAAAHINWATGTTGIRAEVVLVVPTGDPLKEQISDVAVVQGDEADVLSRYREAFNFYNPDYLVRITGDCPLIIPPIITKHILTAVSIKLDYCSNAYEDLRTFVDGYDCEVISARGFAYIVDCAKSDSDKEHVTTYIRSHPPVWAKFGVVLGHVDLADIKLSVDTAEDLNEVRRRKKSLQQKFDMAKGRGYCVTRF